MGDEQYRLSSIDLLPEEASGLINWAILELEKGKRTDSDILFEFNDQLAVMGQGPISKSAFGRYALKKRKFFRGRADYIQFSKAYAQENAATSADERTRMLNDMLKTAIWQAIMDGKTSPKDIASMSKALQSLLAAQRVSTGEVVKETERKEKKVLTPEEAAKRKDEEKMFDAAGAALENSGFKGGAEFIKYIRQAVYNVYEDIPLPSAPDGDGATGGPS